MPFYVYIIFSSKLNKYYTGYTSDVEARVIQHNAGLSSYTSRANDWKLSYKETFETREEAIKREKEIKSKKSRKYIEWLILNLK